MAAQVDSQPNRNTKQAERFRELEGPVLDARDMASLCVIAFEHAGQEFVGIPESEYIKITKDNWALLSFALHQQAGART